MHQPLSLGPRCQGVSLARYMHFIQVWLGSQKKPPTHTAYLFPLGHVFIQEHVLGLWRRSLFPCCVPGIEAAAHDLQVNKPETRGATKHTHAQPTPTYAELQLDAFQTASPPTSPPLQHPPPLHRLALSPSQISGSTPSLTTHTHTRAHTWTHTAPPTAHSTPLIKGFASSVSRSHAGTPQSGGDCSRYPGSLASYED